MVAVGIIAGVLPDLGHARALVLDPVLIVTPRQPDTAQQSALSMLVEEARARTGRTWEIQVGHELTANPRRGSVRIVAAREDQLPDLLPRALRAGLASCDALARSEGFAIRFVHYAGGDWIIATGHDDRGMLYALGHLLRKTDWGRDRAILHEPRPVCVAPAMSVRGHQLGYRAKNNTYDGWTVGQFEQYLRDLAIFGMNTVELLPPVTDDAPTSPLFPQPALATMVAVSGLARQYGLRCSVFYPALARNYRDPAVVSAELEAWDEVLRRLPQLDELFVPGGDPGHTEPDVLFAFLEQLAPRLHRHHPQATIWVSAQGFNAQQMEVFYRLVSTPPRWLAGVVFGPQSRDPIERQRARIPAALPIRLYPDITHTHHAQFPVPHWDPGFALTEGREPINPQPRAQTLIFRHFAPYVSGFVTYSEGVNDDVNKMIWSALGVAPEASPMDTLADYARWFAGAELGSTAAKRFGAGLAALERNWEGPLASNARIGATLRSFQQIESVAAAATQHNWRLQLGLYRAWFDALEQRRAREQTRQEQLALERLARVAQIGSVPALEAAQRALGAASHGLEPMRAHLEKLAAELFAAIRLQLSVPRYGASAVDRGANLDTAGVSLADHAWLRHQFDAIRAMPEESRRRAAIQSILSYERPVPGAYYDDLGEPGREPHLVLHDDFANDPDLRHTAHDGIADATPDQGWRRSWITYAGALYDEPLTLSYDDLLPQAHYRVRVTYAGEDYTLPMQLLANGHTEIHGARRRRSNPETVEFDIPATQTASGHLTLSWRRPAGEGGSGRGCQVAEVWLLPQR